MVDTIRKLRLHASLRVFVGMLLFVGGLLLVESQPALAILAIFALLVPGIALTSSGAGGYLRASQLRQTLRAQQRQQVRQTRALEGLEGHVFALLLTIAEADGRSTDRERELVRQFLLERFEDPHMLAALRRWDGAPLAPNRVEATCRMLAGSLGMADREILFLWACLTALVDERFTTPENTLLQAMARGLLLPPAHARRLFHRARKQVLDQQARRQTSQSGERAAALEVLGLGLDASHEDIRRRHRELAKKYHPDAHTARGPAAVSEATDRFREVQRAYEVLRAT